MFIYINQIFNFITCKVRFTVENNNIRSYTTANTTTRRTNNNNSMYALSAETLWQYWTAVLCCSLFFNMKVKVKIIYLRMRGIEGLSSLEGIQIFWILF